MQSQHNAANQTSGTETALSEAKDVTARQPWLTPTVTQLEIKRTMNASGSTTDGGAASEVSPAP